ncbi:MAG: hypothetical protein WA139_02495 [Candidatus Aenigmatarchaeota archaeon]
MAELRNVYERDIYRLLIGYGRPLTTKKIADKLGINWRTAKEHLIAMYRRKIVRYGRRGNRIYWAVL